MKELSAPFDAALLLTLGCNLHCPFCYEHTWTGGRCRELTPEQWLAVLRELAEMQVMRLRLLGGEPLVSPAFEPLIRELPRTKMRFAVISNGTLFNSLLIEQLAAGGRCECVQISLDGTEAVHDRLRGPGTFRRAVSALRELAAAGIPVKLNSVLLRSSLPDLPAFLDLLESLPVESCRLNPLGAGMLPAEMPDLNELAAAGELIFAREPELTKLTASSFPFVVRKMSRSDESDDDAGGRCFRSRIQINIHPDGAVTPCPDVREPVCGYALRQPLAEIWRGPVLEEFRSRCRRDITLPLGECRECPHRAVCRRYCPLAKPEEHCLKKLCALWRERGVKL